MSGRFKLVTGIALMTCALLLVARPASAAKGPVAQVTHAGRWLVAPDGRVLVLHGFNFTAKRPPYLPSRVGFGADDAQWLRAQGFTVVRLGFIPAGVTPSARGVWDDGYLDDFATTVRALTDAGLLVIVDLHQDYYTESTGGEGFPGWMVTRRSLTPGVGRADAAPFDGLWTDAAGVQGDVAAIWQRVAGRLRGLAGIAGYDLFNEPFPGSRDLECAQLVGCPAFDRAVLAPFYARLIAGVRSVDPVHLVLYSPQVISNQGVATSIGRLGDTNAGFSFHVYCSPVSGQSDCTVRRPLAFDNAAAQALSGGDAEFLSEFGATDDVAAIAQVADLADRRMVGWTEWAYWNEDPCCARSHEGLIRDLPAGPNAPQNVKLDKLAALARPYPHLVAGTPLSWAWDPATRVFTASWSTQRPGGAGRAGQRSVTELELPAVAFPTGWKAIPHGGRVVGALRSGQVRIRALPGAETVSVTVQPPRVRRRCCWRPR